MAPSGTGHDDVSVLGRLAAGLYRPDRLAFLPKIASAALMLLALVLIGGLSSSRPAEAQEAAGVWCTVPTPVQCFSNPVTACKAQHDYYAPNNLPFYSGAPFSSTSWKCNWCTHVNGPCPVDTLPTIVTFRCPANPPGTPNPERYVVVPGPRCVKNKDIKRELPPRTVTVQYGVENACVGNPLLIQTATKEETAVDFVNADGTLSVSRNYRSQPSSDTVGYIPSLEGDLGQNWRSNFYLRLQLRDNFGSSPSATGVTLFLPDGSSFDFDGTAAQTKYGYKVQFNGTLPSPPSGIRTTGGQWKVTDPDGRIWILQMYQGPFTEFLLARPITATSPGGYTQTYAYKTTGGIDTVTDSYGRQMVFSWNSNPTGSTTSVDATIAQIVLPDSTRIEYSYNRIGPVTTPATGQFRLAEVRRVRADNTLIDKTTYQYEAIGLPFHLTGVTDARNVRYATFGYDAEGRATSSEHAGGVDRTLVAYSETASEGRRTVTNALGKQATYRYQLLGANKTIGNLLGVDGIASPNCPASASSYTFNANGFIASQTDEEGRITAFLRDSFGRATSVTRGSGTPLASTATTVWNTTLNVPDQVVEPGRTTTYTWNPNQTLASLSQTDTTSQTQPYPTNGQVRTLTYTYDALGRVLSVDGPLAGSGDTISYTYGANGYLSTITNQVGQVTTVNTVNGRGLPTRVTDPNLIPTDFVWDDVGRLTSTTVNPGASGSTTTMGYNAVGDITSITQPGGANLTFAYDDARRLTSITNLAGESIVYTRDNLGNVTNIKLRRGTSVVAERNQVFDELGRLLRTVGMANQTWAFGYDKTSNRTRVTDPRTKNWGSAFDALNRLTSETTPLTETTTLTFNGTDDVVSFSDPRSLVTTYVRNGFGDVIRQTSPDTGITDYVYDARGLVTQITDARSVVTQFTYDAAGRLLTRTYPAAASENVTYTWDSTTGGNAGKGRLTGVTDESGTHSRFYDPRGNLLQDNRVIAGRSYATTYTYDSADRIASITYPSGRIITYTRDTSGRITGITTRETSVAPVFTVASGIAWQPMAGMASDNPPSAGTATQLQALPGLDGFGSVDLLQALTYGNGLQQWKTFTTDNEVDLIQLYNGSTVLTQRDIDRQDGMNVTGIADAITPANNQNFGYSDAARLTTASGPYGARSWTYDGVGNRTGETIASVSTVWSYVNGTNRLSTVVQGATTQRSFTYDTAGNITQDLRGATAYVYGINKAGRLSTLTVGGTARATYTYDAFGRLAIRALVNGTPSGTTHVLWDQDGHVIAEHTAAGAVVREYVWLNDQPITVFDASTAPTKQYAVHVDQLDRPVRMTDANKAVVWDAYYEPFGGVVSLTGPAALDLRLPGQWFQIEAGLAYNWHRHYDPTLGRYTQPDPLGVDAGASLYGYAGQSPQMKVDPNGLELKLFGPSAGLKYGKGRVCGIICSGYQLRLDFDKNPSGTKLHFHCGPLGSELLSKHRPWFAPWRLY